MKEILSGVAVLVVVLVVGCTGGSRCDEEHPCGEGEVCFEGFCGPPCPAGATILDEETCSFEMAECFPTSVGPEGQCSKQCTRDPASTYDNEISDCPRGFKCQSLDNGSGPSPFFCVRNEGFNQLCNTDADCAGLSVEVSR